MIKFEKENIKKRMQSGTFLTSKLWDKTIKMPSKSHETIPRTTIVQYSATKQ
jgi:hypothetical protein